MKADKTNHHQYNKTLQPFARNLRNNGTKAEACLWKYALRAGQMKGYEFRRQRPVLRFIADFMCFDLKLVIEVDGFTHLWDETAEKDRVKETALVEAGFTVMRFTDEEVLKDMNGVIRQIEYWIEMREETSPLPPSKGG